MKLIKNKSGFSLIEILLYFFILAFILLAAMTFALQILSENQRSGNSHEIQSTINFVSEKITSKVKMANSVNVAGSTFNNPVGTLSLNMLDAAVSPTNFYLENENIYIKEGLNTAIKLNSDSVKCVSFEFQRLTYPKTPDQIIFDVECHPLNEELAGQSQTFNIHSSISLRK